MATSGYSRQPFTAGLGRGAPPPQQPQNPLNAYAPAAYAGPSGGAYNSGVVGGPGAAAEARARQERERAAERERLERERREADERAGALEALSEEQREEINEAFSLFDLDKDNHIDYHELKVALKALGFDLPKSDILTLLQTHGIPASTLQNPGSTAANNAAIKPSFSGPSRLLMPHASFVSIAAQRILARDPRDEILRAFDLFDAEGKGSINLVDLRRVARELGEGLQEEELVAMIEEFDLDGDGAISRDEFVGICLG